VASFQISTSLRLLYKLYSMPPMTTMSTLSQVFLQPSVSQVHTTSYLFHLMGYSSPKFTWLVFLCNILFPPMTYPAIDDLFESLYFTTYQPSAIASINGVDATTYLTRFASKNSYGTLEPHADWNQLMLSPALDIQGFFDVFSGGATFYPGDTITFKLENGTEISDYYLAIYNSPGPTGPLETGGDFYNFFVLGFYPASFDPFADDSSASSSAAPSSTPTSAATSTIVSSATPTLSWNNSAYPDVPDVAQADLGIYGGGYISGRLIHLQYIFERKNPVFPTKLYICPVYRILIYEQVISSTLPLFPF
jgi:hypothetical protein